MRILNIDGTITTTTTTKILNKLAGEKQEDDFVNKYDLNIEKLKIVTQDSTSGEGHYIFLPRGAILFNLIKEYIYGLYADLECFYIETPVLTDFENLAVVNHVEQSGENTYHTNSSGRHLVTKIGVLYSQMGLVGKNGLSSSHLPLKLFEMTKCCRLEEKYSPLRRACEFTMIDMHELFNNLNESLDESLQIHKKILELAAEFNLDFYCTYKVTNDFLEKNLEWILQLVRLHEREALLLEANPRKGRPINVEYHFDVGEGNPLEVSAFQLDYDNPIKFGILKEDGSNPIVLHANIVGSIERFMYAILSRIIDGGCFPMWLAPEQVRLIPDSVDDLELCIKYASMLNKESLRVTIDDQLQCSTEQRYALAKESMIPVIVHVRAENASILQAPSFYNYTDFRLKEFTEQVKLETKGKPFMRATYPHRLSQWPGYF
ncbi:aminoacyl--tRNA ligase-related protein [Sporomusa sp. KB1]|jgi:threonyl-tRNA synthetase|uniref:aminoacyl--tRNA ligase-related protein n=1 Tax=Sporomusa sp. KB1 TaxID=943346 RepID=UPI0011A39E74|nr:aminoacyl--tRNA ligase-related protein [Sporomusa sp. KB1]TWH51645.1 Threonyl-tRNA synthetase [Sporomusa sp. KB1]TWH52224.1 Threonyl-tRNA synthetase [Sporomusa sp. KB1]